MPATPRNPYAGQSLGRFPAVGARDARHCAQPMPIIQIGRFSPFPAVDFLRVPNRQAARNR
ncbi:hypothetical protein C2U63_14780 [Burkholderia pseudomallei]|nr:hypothetical protein EXY28_03740 [Burkholderia pseudomallei]QBI47867.1 hypothetical protein EXY72_03765 [Burkholderia pseudomallei]QBL79151.1 hypothetical protein EYA82_03805 [Burkholderia pseudomallei]QBL85762.1 hypothetical protein EYA88_03775 [Burkholderia pseudomallei]QBP56272.1 hypothetical protein E2R23_03755 [Burkholderia pseudomallei]